MEFWHLPSQLYIPMMELHNENKALEHKDVAIIYTAVRASITMAHDKLYLASRLTSAVVLKHLNLDQ
jgi:hypothetical protein